ncbi:MAG: hypothetical protein II909_01150 [Kiritimatiellae bacterium]|nr:hypothetical protein [Kiritimatiellia bacterium]
MTAAFEGGKLVKLEGEESSREAVIALPLSRLVLKLVRIEAGRDVEAEALPVLQAMSPYPDEPLTVSCEQVHAGANANIYVAAAMPESSADELAAALDEAKLNVTRIDALCFGEIRTLWSELKSGVRTLVLLRSVDCISLLVLDDGVPVAIRALDGESDLKREVILSLIEAEDFGGVKPLAEILVRGEVDTAAIERLAPVRRLAANGDELQDALKAIRDRTSEGDTLNALPESWRQMLEETRFKRKLNRFLAVAGGIWVLAMAVLFGVPLGYDFLTDYQKGLSKEHAREYRAVREMRDKVKLVRKYSDHDRGALEIMKAVSDRLPEGIELSSWNFKREDGVRVSGEGTSGDAIYLFKDQMAEIESEDGEKIFPTVNLKGPSSSKAGKYKFDLDCTYETEEGGE